VRRCYEFHDEKDRVVMTAHSLRGLYVAQTVGGPMVIRDSDGAEIASAFVRPMRFRLTINAGGDVLTLGRWGRRGKPFRLVSSSGDEVATVELKLRTLGDGSFPGHGFEYVVSIDAQHGARWRRVALAVPALLNLGFGEHLGKGGGG
jgi:hypothetical protein